MWPPSNSKTPLRPSNDGGFAAIATYGKDRKSPAVPARIVFAYESVDIAVSSKAEPSETVPDSSDICSLATNIFVALEIVPKCPNVA